MKVNLHQHVQSIPNGVKYICDLCEYKTITQGNLHQNFQSIHNGVKHSYEFCECKGSTKGSIHLHVQFVLRELDIVVISVNIKEVQRAIFTNLFSLLIMELNIIGSSVGGGGVQETINLVWRMRQNFTRKT